MTSPALEVPEAMIACASGLARLRFGNAGHSDIRSSNSFSDVRVQGALTGKRVGRLYYGGVEPPSSAITLDG